MINFLDSFDDVMPDDAQPIETMTAAELADCTEVVVLVPPTAAVREGVYGEGGGALCLTEYVLNERFPKYMALLKEIPETGKVDGTARGLVHGAIKDGMHHTQLRDLLRRHPNSQFKDFMIGLGADGWRRLLEAKITDIMTGNTMPKGMFPHLSPVELKGGFDRMEITSTIENLETYLRLAGMEVRYNESLKRVETRKNGGLWARFNDNELAAIRSELKQRKARSEVVADAAEYFSAIADKNRENPFAEMQVRGHAKWMAAGRPDMLKQFAETLTVAPEDIGWRDAVIRRFMVAGVMLNQVAENAPMSANRMVLTLAGEQNLGKSRWASTLVGGMHEYFGDGKHVNTTNKDSVKQCISTPITELAEVDGITRKQEASNLKGFFSTLFDVMRLPYAKAESYFRRRTLFVATVNMAEFMVDETGNTRFIPIKCLAINHTHGLDMELVWGQAFDLWKNGEQSWMTEAEINELRTRSEEHMTANPYEDLIYEKFETENADRSTWIRMTALEVFKYVAPNEGSYIDTLGRQVSRDIKAAIARATGSEEKSTTITTANGGRRKVRAFDMPPQRIPDGVPEFMRDRLG
jgi:predicted P-loop ATPase